jgi:hypothetical protein
MIRIVSAVLLASGLLLATWCMAQDPQPPAEKGAGEKEEPPLRLKKKTKPGEEKPDQPAEPKKPAAEDKKTDEPAKDPVPTEAQENEKEVFDRVAKNMRSLEERLANKELGDAIRQTGEDIAKDLDSLIRAMESPPPQGGAGGGGDESQNDPSSSPNGGKSQGSQKNQNSQKNQGKQGGQKNRGNAQQQPGGQRTGSNGSGTRPGGQMNLEKGQNPMGGQGEKNNDPTGTSNKNRTSDNEKGGELNNNADLYKDIWGHLPEALRAEMNAYSSDKEMIPKYDALIKKCSRAIAEQSSRKDK